MSILNVNGLCISAIAGLTLCLQAPIATAQDFSAADSTKSIAQSGKGKALPRERQAKTLYDAYILGPGDALQIELLDLPELSGRFSIGPDGTLYLPRLRALYVEGLTIEGLREFLTQQFKTYVREPQIYIRPIVYRPIRIYVGGEVKRPGYYTLTGVQSADNEVTSFQAIDVDAKSTHFLGNKTEVSSITGGSSSSTLFPTVFDAIRSAQGITPYTDLREVKVIRKRAESIGGGRMQTNLNFFSLITEGDESQNIRLFDGDVIKVGKSPVVLREQLLKAGQSNLSPQYMEVFVTGRVITPGGVKLPQGSSLNQAISLAGGTKPIKGKVEFIRFSREGSIVRKTFSYQPSAAADSPNNPILAAGDLIRIQDSLLSGGVNIANEVTQPIGSLFSIYYIFRGLNQ